MIDGQQMTIFDLLYPEQIDPLHECAKHAGPHWKQSREDLIKLAGEDPDIERWTKAVRKNYCPYGASGYYGMADKPNALTGYDMRTEQIKITYNDLDGKKCEIIRSWQDFAREVMDLIWSGEYREEEQ